MRLVHRLLATAAALALLGAPSAFAQEKPVPKPAPVPAKEADSQVSEVVVTGQRPAVVTSIDRKSYSVARDLQSTTGSVADVLRNLPSVDVDVDGNVSLRGQSVEILVDGKPSAMFTGQLRNTTLQQLPANTIENIEVMTNPSAEFRPDGSGGVINLITKKPVKIGKSGSVQASVGSYDRWQTSANGAVTNGKATWTASLGARANPNRQSSLSEATRIDSILGQRQDSVGDSTQVVEVRNLNANLSVDYEATPRDRMTVSAGFFKGEADISGLNTSLRQNAAGVVIEDLTLSTPGNATFDSGQFSAIWRHTFAEPGRLLVVNARYSEGGSLNDNLLFYDYATPQPDRDETRRQSVDSYGINLSVNYTLPLADKAVFKAGYEFQREGGELDVFGSSTSPLTGVTTPLPNITNLFALAHINHQVFATYQRPVGKLSVLAGLRLEDSTIEYDQRTTAIAGTETYFEVHPTMHLQYELTGTQKLTVSYSHRVQRPGYMQLNPFVSYYDEYNAQAGNPTLRPQETHSYEAGWQWAAPKATISTTLFYRQNYNTIGPVSRYLTPLVLLNTFENQGTSTSSGLELSATGRVWGKVSYNLGGTVFYNKIQRSTLAGGGTRSAVAYTAKGNIDYRATDKDLLQLRLSYNGKSLTSQGYREAFGSVDLGYQRKIRPDLILTATANDIFESVKFTNVTDVPSLQSRSTSYPIGRTFSIGITKQFGGRPVREGQFDYSTPTAPEAGAAGGVGGL